MDEDGYPDEEKLQDIRDAAGFQPEDACALLEQVRKLWHWPNYATVTEAGDKLRHEFCTGGWSGNESLIAALEDNTMFWLRWWYLSERGGRYVFETPNKANSDYAIGQMHQRHDGYATVMSGWGHSGYFVMYRNGDALFCSLPAQ